MKLMSLFDGKGVKNAGGGQGNLHFLMLVLCELFLRSSLGSFFIPSSYKNSQIYLCEPCLKKLSEKIAKQLQNEGD